MGAITFDQPSKGIVSSTAAAGLTVENTRGTGLQGSGGHFGVVGETISVVGVGGQGGVFGVAGGHGGEAGMLGIGATGVRGMGGVVGVDGHGPENSRGFLGGIDPVFSQRVGVYGQSFQHGVIGLTTTAEGKSGTGVYGGPASRDGSAGGSCVGVRGETYTGVAVQGRSLDKSGKAGHFIGDVVIDGTITGPGGDLEARIAELENVVAAHEKTISALLAHLNGLQPRVDASARAPQIFEPQNFSDDLDVLDLHLDGREFLPTTTVTLWVADASNSPPAKASEAGSDAAGSVHFRVQMPNTSHKLFFAATDGRLDRHDLTGLLWSGTASWGNFL
ncbi:hypothetical protein [Paraburkholderia sediminicola]|uniref:hypothetical protein n=1 Tax=Paraburkholderia sediminicola TaxID=458836 RepID=UPI0038B933FB